MRRSISPFERDFRAYSARPEHYYSDYYLTEPNYYLPSQRPSYYEQPFRPEIDYNYSNYLHQAYPPLSP